MEMQIQPFDLQRMFFGQAPALYYLEIIVRTFILYIYSLIMIRLMGKRGLNEMTPFEYIVIISLGSAIGDPMFYSDIPLFYGILVITIIVMLEQLLAKLTKQNEKVHNFVESKPALLIKHSQIQNSVLDHEQLSHAEVMMKLRQQGISDLGEVETVYLEPSGKLSIFPREPKVKIQTTLPQDINN